MREKYLDGLRGWAALVVVVTHTVHGVLWAQWTPQFRPFFSDGSLAVGIFFVLSGYVLTVEYFRSGKREVIADLALRRYPRLTIPIIAISIVAMALMMTGLMFNKPAGIAVGNERWLSVFYGFKPTVSNLLDFSLMKVYTDMQPAYSYNSSLWTMPIEMVGSLVVFGAVVIIGRSPRIQLVTFIVSVVIAVWIWSWFFAMILGVAIARICQTETHRNFRSHPSASAITWAVLAGAFLLAAMRPKSMEARVVPVCGAAIIYAVLVNVYAQKVLSTKLSQWLGRISFSLYLVHILIICSLTSWLYLRIASNGVVGVQEKIFMFIVTIMSSIAVAALFHPVERLGIAVGRGLSRACLQRWSPARRPKESV